MDETNLLSLIRPWLDNICQITTKTLQWRFAKKFGNQTVPWSMPSIFLEFHAHAWGHTNMCHSHIVHTHYYTFWTPYVPSIIRTEKERGRGSSRYPSRILWWVQSIYPISICMTLAMYRYTYCITLHHYGTVLFTCSPLTSYNCTSALSTIRWTATARRPACWPFILVSVKIEPKEKCHPNSKFFYSLHHINF
jgi:hypothetical protein